MGLKCSNLRATNAFETIKVPVIRDTEIRYNMIRIEAIKFTTHYKEDGEYDDIIRFRIRSLECIQIDRSIMVGRILFLIIGSSKARKRFDA